MSLHSLRCSLGLSKAHSAKPWENFHQRRASSTPCRAQNARVVNQTESPSKAFRSQWNFSCQSSASLKAQNEMRMLARTQHAKALKSQLDSEFPCESSASSKPKNETRTLNRTLPSKASKSKVNFELSCENPASLEETREMSALTRTLPSKALKSQSNSGVPCASPASLNPEIEMCTLSPLSRTLPSKALKSKSNFGMPYEGSASLMPEDETCTLTRTPPSKALKSQSNSETPCKSPVRVSRSKSVATIATEKSQAQTEVPSESPVRGRRSKSVVTFAPDSPAKSPSKNGSRPASATKKMKNGSDRAFPGSPSCRLCQSASSSKCLTPKHDKSTVGHFVHSCAVCSAIMRNPQAGPKVRRLTNVFDQVCAAELLHNHMLNLSHLRLYFKGLTITPEQINLKNAETKWTFLHHFAYQGDVGLVEWGLQAGACHSAVTAMGKTPLHLAAENNKSAAVVALLKGGADPNAKTLAGFTCLHLAVLNGHGHVVSTLLENSIAPCGLRSSTPPLNVEEDSLHGTALDMARDPKIREMLEEFMEYGFLKSSVETKRSKLKRILLEPLSTKESIGQPKPIPLCDLDELSRPQTSEFATRTTSQNIFEIPAKALFVY